MFRYKGGRVVAKGTYWNFANGSRIDIAEEGLLPGDEESTYIRVPPVVVLLASPLAGLSYVIALQFITIVTVVRTVGEKILARVLAVLGPLVSFGWRPREAHFQGRRQRKKK